MNQIYKNIEIIRKKKDIKQDVVAAKMGIAQGSYSQLFTRNKDIKFNRLIEIAKILDVPVIDIITYPIKYVPENSQNFDCQNCKDKDDIIRHLNNYIKILEQRLNISSIP